MKFLILISFVALSSCATSFKGKLSQKMALGAGVGALYGSSKDHSKDAHSLMWAGVGAATGALFSMYMDDPDKEVQRLIDESKRLRMEMDEMRSPKLEATVSAFPKSQLPSKYQRLVSPGEWRIYEIDEWVEEGDSRLVHRDKIMELVPPSLKPQIVPIERKE